MAKFCLFSRIISGLQKSNNIEKRGSLMKHLCPPAKLKSFFAWYKSALLILSLFFGVSVFGQYNFQNRCHVVFNAEKVSLSNYKASNFSKPEQIREVEKRFAEQAMKDANLPLALGAMDTNVMQWAYKESGAWRKWYFATFKDAIDIFPSRLVTEKKLQEGKKKGIHFADYYGKDVMLDFKVLENFTDRIPNSQFYFSHENTSFIHKLYANSVKIAFGGRTLGKVAKALDNTIFFGNEVLSKYTWQGGGNFRHSRTRFEANRLTRKEVDEILRSYDELSAPGMPFESVPRHLEGEFRMKAEYPYAIARPFVNSLKKNSDGTYNVKFSYPSAKIVKMGTEMVYEWANREMHKLDTKAEDARDPIELAAVVQYALVYLHPFKDGNGRIVKILRDKVLEKYDLPFDLRYGETLGTDLTRSLEDFVGQVRFGVFYAINRLAELDTKYTKGANSNVTPSVLDTNTGLNLGGFDRRNIPKQVKKRISDKSFPEKDNMVFTLGGGEAMKDGVFKREDYIGAVSVGRGTEMLMINRGSFFQEAKSGMTYTYVPKENALYPISDWSLSLYGQGGELFRKNTGHNMYNFRRPNPTFRAAIDNNLMLLKGITAFEENPNNPKAINPASIRVKPYEALEKAQDMAGGFGSIYLYDFQKSIINDMFSGRVDPKRYPVATLAAYRGNQSNPKRSGPTELQEYFTTGKAHKVTGDNVMAAYSLRRTELIKLEMDMKELHPELLREAQDKIRQAREDIYIAARSLLGDYPNLLREIFTKAPGKSNHPKLSGSQENIEFHRWAKKNQLWQALNEYAKNHEWYYETFAKGMKEVEQSEAVVIRNIADGFHLKLLGIATEAQQATVLKLIPGLPSLFKAMDAEIKTANREGRKLNPKEVDGLVSSWILQWKGNDFDTAGNKKEDGKEKSRKEFRAFVDKIVNGVLTDYYSTRGTDVEFERPFIDLYLHTVGFHPQVMKSTSVNPMYEWILNGKSELKFFAGGVSFLYRVKINEEAVSAVFSPYRSQAEVVENAWIHPLKLPFRKVIKVSEEGLRLHKVEDGKVVRDANGDLVYTQNGAKTMQIIDSIVNLEQGTPMVPAEVPIYNSRYERIDHNGNRIQE